jgi:hypothetical protein
MYAGSAGAWFGFGRAMVSLTLNLKMAKRRPSIFVPIVRKIL